MKNVIENNKLIAGFMGKPIYFLANASGSAQFNSYGFYLTPKDVPNQEMPNTAVGSMQLDYHTSYNSLIPVMQQIYMTATAMPKEYYNVTHTYAIATIDEMYNTVIEFIKWFNQYQNENV